MIDDDRDLRGYFAAVRREEEAQAPPMPMVWLAAREYGRQRVSGKLAGGAACLAMLIAALIGAGVWLRPGSRVSDGRSNRVGEQAAASITSWRPATDFLLDTPGRELLEGVPKIGEWDGALNAPGNGASHRHLKRRIFAIRRNYR